MRAIRESPLQPVGNDRRRVPQNHIKIHGRAWKPTPTTGRRVVAPYARNIFFRVVAGDSPVRGNVRERGQKGARFRRKSTPA